MQCVLIIFKPQFLPQLPSLLSFEFSSSFFPIESSLCCPSSVESGVCSGMWLATRCHVTERKTWLFFSQQLSADDSFSDRGGSLHLCSMLCAGIFHAWFFPALVNTASVTVSSPMLLLMCLLLSLTIFTQSLLRRSFSSGEKRGHFTVCYSIFTFEKLMISALIAISYKEKLLWWGLRDAVTIDKPLGVMLMLCLFNGLIVLGSLLEPVTYLATGCWFLKKCQIRVLSHGLTLDPESG